MAWFRFPIVIAILLALAPAARAADTPVSDPAARQIESFYAVLIDSMKQGPELGLQGRFRQLTSITQETFDLPGMTRISVGPSWEMISETDRKTIIDAFERLTIANYAKHFAQFSGQKFIVNPMVKMRDGDKIVESKLVSGKSTVPFNYRMRMADGKWKVVDVFLNGYVSQLAVRRADFASTVASSGASGLVKKINELVDKEMAGS
jgi:phospholipid transport system substrate-binding protein